jgi:hypothetical protein
MIQIGRVLFGRTPDAAELERAISELARDFQTLPTGPAHIDLVFVIGGRIRDPDFDGIRVGRFSAAERMVQVQVAVPKIQLAYMDRDGIRKQAATAITIGSEYLNARGLRFDPVVALSSLPSPSSSGPSNPSAAIPEFEIQLPDRKLSYTIDDVEFAEERVRTLLAGMPGVTVSGHEVGDQSASIFVTGLAAMDLDDRARFLETLRLDGYRVLRDRTG